MRFYRRAGSPFVWVDVTVASGRRIRRSTGATDETQAALRLKDVVPELVDRPAAEGLTVKEAFARYYTEHAQHLPSGDDILRSLTRWLDHLGEGRRFDAFGSAEVAGFVARRRGQVARRRKGRLVSAATVNLDVDFLKAVHTMARKRWAVPVTEIDWRAQRLIAAEPRRRWMTPAEADKLMATARGRFPYLANMIYFALHTGVRRDNVERLEWSQIDLQERTATFRVKSKRPGRKLLVVPLHTDLVAFLAELPGDRDGRVWRRDNGRPIADIEYAWRKTMEAAEITDVRFHDWRRTCANWLRRRRVPVETIKEILGHARIETTLGYLDVGADDKRAAMETLAGTPTGTKAPKNGRKARK